MVRLVAVRRSITAPQAAQRLIDNVFRHHGLPESLVSDQDPRFVSAFRQHVLAYGGLTGYFHGGSSANGRVNRVLEYVLRSVCVDEPMMCAVSASGIYNE